MAILAESETNPSKTADLNSGPNTGAVYVAGISNDTIDIEHRFRDTDDFVPVNTDGAIDANGVYSLVPRPPGEYRVSQNGSNDTITVILK